MRHAVLTGGGPPLPQGIPVQTAIQLPGRKIHGAATETPRLQRGRSLICSTNIFGSTSHAPGPSLGSGDAVVVAAVTAPSSPGKTDAQAVTTTRGRARQEMAGNLLGRGPPAFPGVAGRLPGGQGTKPNPEVWIRVTRGKRRRQELRCDRFESCLVKVRELHTHVHSSTTDSHRKWLRPEPPSVDDRSTKMFHLCSGAFLSHGQE